MTSFLADGTSSLSSINYFLATVVTADDCQVLYQVKPSLLLAPRF
jgi:hypothetical protein